MSISAGLTIMGVTQDDGCRVTAGAQRDLFGALYLGGFDGAGLAADGGHIFYVVAPEAGVYPFRVVWVQGADTGNLEWFTVKADGTKVLVNDRANGGLSAYRARAPIHSRKNTSATTYAPDSSTSTSSRSTIRVSERCTDDAAPSR